MLETSRLRLRRWQPSDQDPFAQLNADPEVMRYFPALLSRKQSDALIDRFEAEFDQRGFSFWAVDVKSSGSFIGFVGLNVPSFEASFLPAVEVGWRLARAFWGLGYATEAGNESLRYGFEVLELPEIVSFTAKLNNRSRAVMERLGMHRDVSNDFEHPRIPIDHPLRPHVLYRLRHQNCHRLNP